MSVRWSTVVSIYTKRYDAIRYDSWTNDEYYSVIVSVGVQYSINRHDTIRVDEYCSVILRTLEYSIVSIDTIQFVEYS